MSLVQRAIYSLSLLLISRPFVRAEVFPQIVQWSSASYGPDGPWQAVQVTVGTPPQPIDLIPGGPWQSAILASSVCSNGVACIIPRSARFYEPDSSSTATQVAQTGGWRDQDFAGKVSTLPSVRGSGEYIFDTIGIPIQNGDSGNNYNAMIESFVMTLVTNASDRLPDGTTYPPQIGTLGLGSPDFNQTWQMPAPSRPWNGTMLTSAMFGTGKAPSNSYGMHIGSANMRIPGALALGGYEQNRVLGPVSSQGYSINHLPIDLLDIGIGVAEGASPFNETSISGLLAKGNSSIGLSTTVFVEAPLPYMYLPKSTCDAIASYLPVRYQSKYGLYFWNTQDPNYKRIVTSPSYLSFTFRLSGSSTQNMTINVPFALLNLTLTAPLTDTPTQYLPLRPGPGPDGTYLLGRAFLQAAFIGVNWQTAGGDGSGVWYLAQAPGPNIASQKRTLAIKPSDNTITASDVPWKDTWRGFWTVLDSAKSIDGGINVNTTDPATTLDDATKAPSQKGLPMGAIIGIAVGGGVLFLLGGLAIFLLRRRSRRRKMEQANHPPPTIHGEPGLPGYDHYQNSYKGAGFGPSEMESERKVAEMADDHRIAEMPG